MINSNQQQTRGQRVVEEWTAEIDKHDDDLDWDDLADLASRIDAELAESAPKRALDLTGIPQERRLSVSEKRMVAMVNIDHVKAAIRQQLPEVEVRT